MTKLSYEDWEKDPLKNKWPISEEKIETMKTKHYFGLNTYDDICEDLIKSLDEINVNIVKTQPTGEKND